MASQSEKGKPRKIGHQEGVAYPILCCVFLGLKYLSILTYLKCKESWSQSRAVVDLYVIAWLGLGLGFLFLLHLCPFQWVRYLILALAMLRVLDIVQAWWNIYFVPPYDARAPRNIVLTLVNYAELVFAFAIVGFVLTCPPYFEQGSIEIWGALRASFRTMTPLGLTEEPPTLPKGALFYLEYVLGLIFLVVLINIVLSYMGVNARPRNRARRPR